MPVIETQTCALDIRDAFYNVVSADPFFAGFTKRRTKMLPVQQQLIPYLGVYLVDEMMLPDGDANAGCVRFLHTARIGFSVVIANSDQDIAEHTADQAMQRILISAYTNYSLMNVLVNENPEGVGTEGIVRGQRRMLYGAISTDNETPFVELQYETSCSFRTEWYPDITDTLDEIDVVTGIKLADTQNVRDTREQVNLVYDMTALPAPTRRIPRAPLRRPWLPARNQNRR